MRKWVLLILTTLLLAGCQAAESPEPAPEQPPEPASVMQAAAQWLSDESHHAFYVNNHVVTVERAAEPAEDCKLILTVWDREDPTVPIQTIPMAEDARYGGDKWLDPAWSRVEDFNFDYYEDFGCVYAMGNQPVYYHVWLWDPEAGQYVYEPAFDRISDPWVDWEEHKITGWARDGAAAGDYSFHQWVDGVLTEVRHIRQDYEVSNEHGVYSISVTGLVDGKMQEVFFFEGDGYDDVADRWRNLWYTGEN